MSINNIIDLDDCRGLISNIKTSLRNVNNILDGDLMLIMNSDSQVDYLSLKISDSNTYRFISEKLTYLEKNQSSMDKIDLEFYKALRSEWNFINGYIRSYMEKRYDELMESIHKKYL